MCIRDSKTTMKKGFCFSGRIAMPKSCGSDLICNIFSKAIGPNAALVLSGCINTKEVSFEIGVENIRFSSKVLLLSGGLTFATLFKPPQLQFGVEAHLQVQIKGPTIFIGKMYIGISASMTILGFAFAMTGSLVPVFNIFNLFDLVLEAEVGITNSVPPAPVVRKLIIGGGFCIGKYDNCKFLLTGATEEELVATRVLNHEHTNFSKPSHVYPHAGMEEEMEFVGNEDMDLWDHIGHGVTNPTRSTDEAPEEAFEDLGEEEDDLHTVATNIEGLQDQLLEAQSKVRKLEGVAEEKHRRLQELQQPPLISEVADDLMQSESTVGKVGRVYGLAWKKGGCKNAAQFQLSKQVVYSTKDAVEKCRARCAKNLACNTFLVGRKNSRKKSLRGACWIGRAGCVKDSKSKHWDAYERFEPTIQRGQCRLPGGKPAYDESLTTTRGTLEECAISLFQARKKDPTIQNSEYSHQLKTCWVIKTKQAKDYVPNHKTGYTCLKLLGFASGPKAIVVSPSSVTISPGWCQGKAMQTGKYPDCLSTCGGLSSCAAVRWVVANKKCELLSECGTPNKDKGWKHVRFPTVEKGNGWCKGRIVGPGIYPQCIEACQVNSQCKGVRWQLETSRCDLLDSCDPVGCDTKDDCNGHGSTYSGNGEYCQTKDMSCCDKVSKTNKKCKKPPCWNHGKVCPDGKPGKLSDSLWKHARVLVPYDHQPYTLADGEVGLGALTSGGKKMPLPKSGKEIVKANKASVKPVKMGSIKGVIAAKVYVGFDLSGSFFVYAAISRITMADICGVFVGGASKLPPFFGKIGIEPFDMPKCTKLGGPACFAYLSYNIGLPATIDILVPPLVIPSGIAASGRIFFLGASLGFEFNFDPIATNFHMVLEGSPLVFLGGQVKVCRAKTNCRQGPIFKVDINLMQHRFGLFLSAYGKLGWIAEGGVMISISTTLQEFVLTDVPLFGGKISAGLTVRISVINPLKFFMSAMIITTKISKFLANLCKKAIKPVKAARAAVLHAQAVVKAAFDRANAKLEAAQGKLRAADAKCTRVQHNLEAKKRSCHLELELLEQDRSSPRRLQSLLQSLQTGEGALSDQQLQQVYATVELEAGFKREDLVKVMELVRTKSYATDADLMQVGYGNPFHAIAHAIRAAAEAVARAIKAAIEAACRLAVSVLAHIVGAVCHVAVKIAQGALYAVQGVVAAAGAIVNAALGMVAAALSAALKIMELLIAWQLDYIKFSISAMKAEVTLSLALTHITNKAAPPKHTTWVKAKCPQKTYWKLGHSRDVLSTHVTYPGCKSACDANPKCAAYTVGARNTCTQYSINSFAGAKSWPKTTHPYHSDTERCENGNKLKDGFEYKFNAKRTLCAKRFQCCRRPIKVVHPTRSCKPFAGGSQGQYKRCPGGMENGWSTSTQNCEKQKKNTYWKFTAGHVYRTIMPAPTPAQCEAECAKDTACAAYLINPATNNCILYSAIGRGPVSKCMPFGGGTSYGRVKACARTPPTPPLGTQRVLSISFSLKGAGMITLAFKLFAKLFKALVEAAINFIKNIAHKIGLELMLLATSDLLEEHELVSLSEHDDLQFDLTELRKQKGELFENSPVLQHAQHKQAHKRKQKKEYLEMLAKTSSSPPPEHPMSMEELVELRNRILPAREQDALHSKASGLMHEDHEAYLALRQAEAKQGTMDELDSITREEYMSVRGAKSEVFDMYDLNYDGVIDEYEQAVESRETKEAYGKA
eukprot:TRINITY_DN4652_c0_g1_i1.p1 TRINITY_DN4652_c0_g1~~TRINITY_DN4652_c0_g1_i1.p1  ORF type:complete len:1724 (+),score=371.69 TRINITY_DN4652_c0_g1_i1:94-5265(+)